MTEVKMIPQKRHRIETGDPSAVTVLLVGCGGTGSFAALHLARLAWTLRERGPALRLVFVDPDTVEAKNIGRQNFCPAEVGQPKAEALARRYSLAFGLAIEPVVGRFAVGMIDRYRPAVSYNQTGLLLVVGAVDNNAARKAINKALVTKLLPAALDSRRVDPIWWLDAGNGEHGGQVVIGNSVEAEPVLDPLGQHVVEVPLPSIQEPGLIEPEPEQAQPLSCAELVATEAQSLMVNQAMADWLGVYAYRLLVAHDLDIMATEIDQQAGLAHSRPVVGERRPGLKRGQAERGDPVPGIVYPDDWPEEWPRACPACGTGLMLGWDDTVGGDEDVEEIIFCPGCGWRRTAEAFEREVRAGELVA